MKTQIRSGVFETNSSSTHSLTVTNGSLDEAFNYVKERIIKKHCDSYAESDQLDESHYIIKDDNGEQVLYFNGLQFEDGGESYCVYCIIRSWLAKVQYIASIVNGYKYHMKEYIEFNNIYGGKIHELYEKYGYYAENLRGTEYETIMNNYYPKLQDTEIYKAFINAIMNTCQKFGYNISRVSCENIEENSSFIEDDETKNYFTNEVLSNPKLFEEKITDLLSSEDKTMYYIDEAYNPYDKPSVKVY